MANVKTPNSLYDICKTKVLNLNPDLREIEILNIPKIIKEELVTSHIRRCVTALICFFQKDHMKVCSDCYKKIVNKEDCWYYSKFVLYDREQLFSKVLSKKYKCGICIESCIEEMELYCSCEFVIL